MGDVRGKVKIRNGAAPEMHRYKKAEHSHLEKQYGVLLNIYNFISVCF
jgi:hypothetical protein